MQTVNEIKKRKPNEDPLSPTLLPDWAPYLSVRDVAILFRTTPAAIRKAIEIKDGKGSKDAKATKEDILGRELRRFLVNVTPHRRLFDRKALMAWIQSSLPPLEVA